MPGDSMSWPNVTGIGQTEEIVCFAASYANPYYTVFFFWGGGALVLRLLLNGNHCDSYPIAYQTTLLQQSTLLFFLRSILRNELRGGLEKKKNTYVGLCTECRKGVTKEN